ncbi:MAG: hypothetical protein ACK5O2_12350 [Microthrixaceae bacterium]
MSTARNELAAAFDDLKRRRFPEHPDDPDLSDWVLELAQLDGHIAGLAVTALGPSSRSRSPESKAAAAHGRRLRAIRVVGDDELIYDECLAYVHALERVEAALSGRLGSGG